MKILIQNNDLSVKEINGFLILMILSFFGIALLTGGIASGTTTNKTEVTDTVYVNLDTLSFSEENLKKVIAANDIWYPEIVFNQAKLESGNFKSDIFKENNNLFGFRVFGSWKGKEMAFKNRGHLVFTHWTKSVEHYKMWQKKNYNKKTYLQFLGRVGYAEDKTYLEKIK